MIFLPHFLHVDSLRPIAADNETDIRVEVTNLEKKLNYIDGGFLAKNDERTSIFKMILPSFNEIVLLSE